MSDADPASWEPLVGETRPYLLQAFIPEIQTAGELSFIFFGARFSHAIRKCAKPGDIRVQKEWGGTVEVITPDAAQITAARAFLKYLPAPTTYARVDVVEAGDRLLLMEVEAIEPELFLTYVPEGADRFAEALLA